LLAEGHSVGVTLVKAAVAEWKRRRREVFIPLTYRPGDLAEVDFFEVLVDMDGTRRKAWLFLMRLMYSGRDFAWIYERQTKSVFWTGTSERSHTCNCSKQRDCQRPRPAKPPALPRSSGGSGNAEHAPH
jgi:hypothetical protein